VLLPQPLQRGLELDHARPLLRRLAPQRRRLGLRRRRARARGVRRRRRVAPRRGGARGRGLGARGLVGGAALGRVQQVLELLVLRLGLVQPLPQRLHQPQQLRLVLAHAGLARAATAAATA
jgi:hypothetical protein